MVGAAEAGGGQGRRPCPGLTSNCTLQNEVAKMYNSFQVMYTVGYCLSLGALLLALTILLGLRYETTRQHRTGAKEAGLRAGGH